LKVEEKTMSEKITSAAKNWINRLYDRLKPNQRDWVGIYWVESFIHPESKSDDLVVGPYIGPVTPHVRIKPGSGLCSLAVETKSTVNEPAVKSNSRFLACSTTTESEIVIPIFLTNGKIIGELDIDSNQKSAFDQETQAWLEAECTDFGKSLSLIVD
jgi:GAF domain-containing protein